MSRNFMLTTFPNCGANVHSFIEKKMFVPDN